METIKLTEDNVPDVSKDLGVDVLDLRKLFAIAYIRRESTMSLADGTIVLEFPW